MRTVLTMVLVATAMMVVGCGGTSPLTYEEVGEEGRYTWLNRDGDLTLTDWSTQHTWTFIGVGDAVSVAVMEHNGAHMIAVGVPSAYDDMGVVFVYYAPSNVVNVDGASILSPPDNPFETVNFGKEVKFSQESGTLQVNYGKKGDRWGDNYNYMGIYPISQFVE